jgi:hypothetical protein
MKILKSWMSIKKIYLSKDIIKHQYKENGYSGLRFFLSQYEAIIYVDDFSRWVVEMIVSNEEEKVKKFKLSKIWLVD